jgi:prepilin-type N-terminal cleavage/methylation domain-containing protein
MKRLGFTLVEILVVITVISILATISVVAYNGVQKKSCRYRCLNLCQASR